MTQRPQSPQFDTYTPPDTSTAMQIREALESKPEAEFIHGVTAHALGQSMRFVSQDAARQLFERSRKLTRAIPDAHSGSVANVPFSLIPDKDLILWIESGTIESTLQVAGRSCETVSVGYRLFLRMQEATGVIKECRFFVADGCIEVDRLLEIAEPEFPTADLNSALEWVVNFNVTNRKNWSEWLATQPPKIDPATQQAQIFANGFKMAMEQMGAAPKPTRAA